MLAITMGTPQSLKTLSIAVILSLVGCASGHGARPPSDVKIYEVHPENDFCPTHEAWCEGKTGFVRAQDKEVKPFSATKGYYGLSPEDLQILVGRCPAP